MAPVPPQLSPLGLTSRAFVDAVAPGGKGEPQAFRAYRRFFREGVIDQPPAVGVIPPVVRSLREDTEEGPTFKFVTRLDRPIDADALAANRRTRTGEQREIGTDRPLTVAARSESDGGEAESNADRRLHLGVLAGDDRVRHLDVESVIIPMVGQKGRRTHTLCVSSQVGCAMGCGFCETAQMGLVRSLTASEIVAQWFNATHRHETEDGVPRRIDNIVFMGMGEPMDNAQEVLRAIEILTDHNGPGVPMSKITVSTVGRIDGLRLLSKKLINPGWRKMGLAVSINAPNDEIRSRIMPINRSMPMRDLRDALLEMPHQGTRKVCFEYVLIPGVNDQREHARELADYLEPFGKVGGDFTPRGMVNLIPYNPRRNSPWPAPTEEQTERFLRWLMDERLFVKRRRTKGRSQMAACGQLGTPDIRKRRFVGAGEATPEAPGRNA